METNNYQNKHSQDTVITAGALGLGQLIILSLALQGVMIFFLGVYAVLGIAAVTIALFFIFTQYRSIEAPRDNRLTAHEHPNGTPLQ